MQTHTLYKFDSQNLGAKYPYIVPCVNKSQRSSVREAFPKFHCLSSRMRVEDLVKGDLCQNFELRAENFL